MPGHQLISDQDQKGPFDKHLEVNERVVRKIQVLRMHKEGLLECVVKSQ